MSETIWTEKYGVSERVRRLSRTPYVRQVT